MAGVQHNAVHGGGGGAGTGEQAEGIEPMPQASPTGAVVGWPVTGRALGKRAAGHDTPLDDRPLQRRRGLSLLPGKGSAGAGSSAGALGKLPPRSARGLDLGVGSSAGKNTVRDNLADASDAVMTEVRGEGAAGGRGTSSAARARALMVPALVVPARWHVLTISCRAAFRRTQASAGQGQGAPACSHAARQRALMIADQSHPRHVRPAGIPNSWVPPATKHAMGSSIWRSL